VRKSSFQSHRLNFQRHYALTPSAAAWVPGDHRNSADNFVMVTKGANRRSPGTNTKRSQISFAVTSVALILECLGTQLLRRPAQSLVESPGTLAAASARNQRQSSMVKCLRSRPSGISGPGNISQCQFNKPRTEHFDCKRRSKRNPNVKGKRSVVPRI